MINPIVLLTILVAFLLFVGIIYLRINSASIKGKIGEKEVDIALSFLSRDEYIVLNDLMFINGNHTTQIDHIVVSLYGIFVIETKNYKGWIFGNENKDYWTQNIWGKKYSLYNPLLQNKSHILFLLKKFNILKEKETSILPIVVFLSASKLQLTGNCDCVLGLKKLRSYIRSFDSKIMTMDECNYITSVLQANNIKDKAIRNSHNNNVRLAIHKHEHMVKQGICPNCGGRLVLRNGKYGSFLGCSNYPRCRYTR